MACGSYAIGYNVFEEEQAIVVVAWAKRNWYWLAAGVAATGAVALRQRRAAFGNVPELRRTIKEGPKGAIAAYVGPTGRCQPCQFLEDAPKHIRKRIDREFDHIVQNGPSYWSPHYHPMSDRAPLWKVKVFDHRLWGVPEREKDWVRLVLMRGWVKDKAGKMPEERTQLDSALNTYKEYERRKRGK